MGQRLEDEARRAKTWQSQGLVYDSRTPKGTSSNRILRESPSSCETPTQILRAIRATDVSWLTKALRVRTALSRPWPNRRSNETAVTCYARPTPHPLSVSGMHVHCHRPAMRYVPSQKPIRKQARLPPEMSGKAAGG